MALFQTSVTLIIPFDGQLTILGHLGRPSIVLLAGDDAADAATGVRDVVVVAGDDVAVEVHDGLAGRFAAVHADVEGGRAVVLFDPGFGLKDGLWHTCLLFRRQRKPIRAQAIRDNEHMTR